MDDSQHLCKVLASSRRARSIARRLDEFIIVHQLSKPSLQRALQNVYGAHMFTSSILAQPASPFLSLPTEIRCLIYYYVFGPEADTESEDTRQCIRPIDSTSYIAADDYADSRSSSEQLSLLATCRQVYGEAHKLAFNRTVFKLESWSKNIPISKHLATLGPLQMHLRHVEIVMRPSDLQLLSRDNPFTLMQLPLTKLEIRFIEGYHKGWKGHVKEWYLIVSALCHVHRPRDREGNPQGPRQQIHTVFKEKNKRRAELQRLTYQPSHDDVWHVLDWMRTKKVVVRAPSDMLYKAFSFFGLFGADNIGSGFKGADRYKYLIFYRDRCEDSCHMELSSLEYGGH